MSRICAQLNRIDGDESFSLISGENARDFLRGERKITVALDGCLFGDTADAYEVIADAYFESGEDFPEKLDGQFAVILYDYNAHKLLCARDSFAIKPMYYESTGGIVCLSSDLGLLAARQGFEKQINRDCLAGYFTRGYIQYPDTIYKNVYKVCPGETVIFDADGRRSKHYYNLIEEYKKYSAQPFESYAEAKSAVKSAIITEVSKRCGGGNAAKTFLSGGVDSSLIASLLSKELGKSVESYTLGFSEEKYNEAAVAEKTASILGTRHHELILDNTALAGIFEKIPEYYDEPFGDNSAIPTIAICEEAGKTAGAEIFSGDGGDEFFFGYDGYLIRRSVGHFDPLLCGAGHIAKTLHLDGALPENAKKLLFNFDPETKTQFMNTKFGFYSRLLPDCPTDSIKLRVEGALPVRDWARRSMLVDMMSGVPGTIIKMERATAKNSLSLRLPLTNPTMASLSFRCRDDCFFRKSSEYGKDIKKYLLKELLLEYLPPEQVFRPKKGFSFPQNEWARAALRDRVIDYSDKAYVDRQGIFDYELLSGDITRFLGGENTRLSDYGFYWRWLVFQSFCEKNSL